MTDELSAERVACRWCREPIVIFNDWVHVGTWRRECVLGHTAEPVRWVRHNDGSISTEEG